MKKEDNALIKEDILHAWSLDEKGVVMLIENLNGLLFCLAELDFFFQENEHEN